MREGKDPKTFLSYQIHISDIFYVFFVKALLNLAVDFRCRRSNQLSSLNQYLSLNTVLVKKQKVPISKWMGLSIISLQPLLK